MRDQRSAPWGNPLGRVTCFLALALIIGACASDDGEATGDTTTTSVPDAVVGTEGVASSLTVVEGPNSPISSLLTVEAEVPSAARVTAQSEDHLVQLPTTAELATAHEIPVVGLRADQTYNIAVELTNDQGDIVGAAGEDFTTGPLPDSIVEYEILESDPEQMEPGLTVLDAGSWGAGNNGDPPQLVAIDADGEIVWEYQSSDPLLGDTRLTEDGTLLSQYGFNGLREIDLLGRTIAAYEVGDPTTQEPDGPIIVNSDEVELRSMHHTADRLDNGNYVTVSQRILELTPAERSKLCPDDTSDWNIQDDVFLEFSPDGEVVNLWPLADTVDPLDTPGTDLCIEDNFGSDRDWAHVNAAEINVDRNEILFTARHLDMVGALRYQETEDGPAGELLWAIGPDGVGTIPLDGEPSYHAHGPEYTADGSILVYDNGNGRVDGDGNIVDPPHSRVVRYEIDDSAEDPADWSAREVWSHVDDDENGLPIYADFLGDADEQPNGNVIAHHGGIGFAADVSLGRVIEINPDDEVVFHLKLEDFKVSYRSERIASLYAGPMWREE